MSRWHPSPEEIDDAIDTDLAMTTRGRVLARHLAQCEECAAMRTSLLDIRAQLRALGQRPLPLPHDWDETLAMALRRAREAGIDETRQGRGRRRCFARAAAAVLLLGVGGVLGPRLMQGDVASDPGAPQAAATQPPATGDAGPAPQEWSGSEQSAPAAGAGHVGVSISSGTNYRPVTVGRQMREQLAAAQAQPAADPDRSEVAAEGIDADLAERCTRLMRLGIESRPDDATVRLLDQAQWQGEPAVIVVTDAASGNGMDVWVMPARCMGEQPVAKVADLAAN